MNYRVYLLLFFLSCWFPSTAQDFSKVSDLLERKKQDFNGHLIMVVKQEDSVVYHFETGLANMETRVGIVSASKWLSASVILTLVDEGLLALDDSIGKFLPAFSQYGKGKPTIRQCLSHTSGFPAVANLEFLGLSLGQLVDSMAKYVALKNRPGEVFEYGEMSYRIVGRIAEVVTGKNWEEIFQANIARKCGMTNTVYCWEKGNPALGSGVCSTTSDYLNFLQMVMQKGQFNEIQVLSEKSVLEFHKSQLTPVAQKNLMKSNPQLKQFAKGKQLSYGLGTWIYNYDREKELQVELFCPGALGTFPFLDISRNLYGIILTNAEMKKIISTEWEAISIVKSGYTK